MPMQRRNDWKPRLRQFLAEQGDKQFQFGQQDCGALAGGAIEAMTGENPHAKVAGKYKTMAGALRALKRLGHEDHVAFAASVLTEIYPLYATFGDIAVVDSPDGRDLENDPRRHQLGCVLAVGLAVDGERQHAGEQDPEGGQHGHAEHVGKG